MTLIRRSEDILQNIAPSWTTIHVVPRGVPRYPDKQLAGSIRYAFRAGSFLPNMQPNNRVTLTKAAQPQINSIYVDTIIDGLGYNSIVSINGQEIHQVLDIDEDSGLVQLYSDVQRVYDIGSYVDLHGEPYKVIGNPVSEGKSIVVRGRFKVQIGDKITIRSNKDLLLSGADYKVIAIEGYEQSSTYTWDSVVVFEESVPENVANDDDVWLRAFPGYMSGQVRTPSVANSAIPLGPVAVDYVSGNMTEAPEEDEQLQLQRFGILDTPIDSYPVAVNKNSMILNIPIHHSFLRFFHIDRGEIFIRKDRVVLRCDSEGRASIWSELAPRWTGEVSWAARVNFISAATGFLLYRFEKDGEGTTQEAATGFGGLQTSANFVFNGQDCDKLRIMFKANANAEIEISDWEVVGDSTLSFEYGVMAEQYGRSNWMGGSLMLKPVFRSVADLQVRYDGTTKLNSGKIYL